MQGTEFFPWCPMERAAASLLYCIGLLLSHLSINTYRLSGADFPTPTFCRPDIPVKCESQRFDDGRVVASATSGVAGSRVVTGFQAVAKAISAETWRNSATFLALGKRKNGGFYVSSNISQLCYFECHTARRYFNDADKKIVRADESVTQHQTQTSKRLPLASPPGLPAIKGPDGAGEIMQTEFGRVLIGHYAVEGPQEGE